MLRIRHDPDNPPRGMCLRGCWPAICLTFICTPLAAQALTTAPSDLLDSSTPFHSSATPHLAQILPSAPAPSTTDKTSGTILGTVGNTQAVPISGAHITLFAGDHTESQETTSDDSGHFRFQHVAPGPFTVAVTLPGFDTASASGILQPGQSNQLPPFALALSIVNVTVDAVTIEELGLEQLHAEEKQRLFGAFPNFYVSYNWNAPPLTTKQKFTLATRNAADPGNLLLVGTVAGFEQATNAYPGYRQGAAGYGKRYGAALGNLVAGTYMGGAVLPALFHQDPRYFYKGTGSIRSRFLYAISTAVICRGDNGHRQPAFASVLGDLSAGAISNLYYTPQDREGAGLTFENGLLGIAGDAMNNVFQEFFLRKLTPKAEKTP